ncbi:MAG: stage II sporulation protein M [Clostridia bacterium]|nr:stage II sporulation protein M [Clostridia bacterium]
MKRLNIKKYISDIFLRNKWQFLIVFLSLFSGILFGTYFSSSMNQETADAMDKYINNFVSAYNLQSANAGEVFKFSVYNNIKIIIFIWISGLWVGFLPVNLIQIGAKGYKLGFSVTLLVKSFGVKGIAFSTISSASQIFIMIPALILYSVFNINFSFFQKHSRFTNLSAVFKNEFYIKNLLYLAAIIILSVFVSFLDAYIIPQVLKPICSIWGKY